jgi:hypothetical protein
MKDFNFEPKAGGLERLRLMLDAYERHERLERKILSAVAGALVLSLISLLPWPARTFKFPEEVRGKVQVEGAYIHEVPVSNDGVRLYWILR